MLERVLRVPFSRYLELVGIMAERYVKVRYRGSSLGIFWSVLNPLIMTSLYAMVFGHAFGGHYGSIVQYLFAVFIGFVTINYFSTSTTQALHSVVANGQLMNKMQVPASVFPMATVMSNSMQFIYGIIPVLIVLTLVVGRNPFGLPLLVIPFLVLGLVTIGVSLMTAAAYVFYRDVPHLYELLSFIIFVATPVFYPLSILDPRFRPFVQWTPISLIIEQLRAIVILHAVPTLGSFAASLGWGIVIFAAGWAIFGRVARRFLERL